MRSLLIIGLGSFGMTLARDLVKRGNEVAVIDIDEERINKARGFVDKAMIADGTKREVLEELKIEEFDVAVVNLGDRLDASVLATMHLKELGAKEIVAKAISGDHEKILEMIGVDQIVFPERDMALRLSYALSATNVMDQFFLASDYSLVELTAPAALVGKSLSELDLRNRYGVQVMIIKQTVPEQLIFPSGEFVVKDSDILVVMGKEEALKRLKV